MSLKTYGLQTKRKSSKRAPLKTINADPFDELARNSVRTRKKGPVVYGKYHFNSSSSSSNCSSGSDTLFKSLRLNEDVPFLRTSIFGCERNCNKKRKEVMVVRPLPDPILDSPSPEGNIDWSEIEAFELLVEKKQTWPILRRVLSRPQVPVVPSPETSFCAGATPSDDGGVIPKYSTPKGDEMVLNPRFPFLENDTPISGIDSVATTSSSKSWRPNLTKESSVVHRVDPVTEPTPLKLKPCWVVLTPLQFDGKSPGCSSSKTDVNTCNRSSLATTYCRRKHSSTFGRKVLPLEQSGITHEQQVLDMCHQVHPLPFKSLLPKKILSQAEKIGEGTYGEVFRSASRVLKIVPIQGNFKVNSESQKTFCDVLSEMIISWELSGLANHEDFVSTNYVHLHRVCCARGRYPKKLLQEWRRYARRKESLNDSPDIFPPSQLYIIFEFADGGIDLESYQFSSAAQAKSIVVQIACALAVAENALEFEHRDLHWSNVLVRSTSLPCLDYVLGGRPFSLPSEGVIASVIDFTLSRLGKDGRAIYTDLSQDPSFFAGSGDYQYDIYRKMKQHNGNDWRRYEPRSNVFWLHYLLRKMCEEKRYPERRHPSLLQMRKWCQSVLKYTSSTEFVRSILPNTLWTA